MRGQNLCIARPSISFVKHKPYSTIILFFCGVLGALPTHAQLESVAPAVLHQYAMREESRILTIEDCKKSGGTSILSDSYYYGFYECVGSYDVMSAFCSTLGPDVSLFPLGAGVMECRASGGTPGYGLGVYPIVRTACPTPTFNPTVPYDYNSTTGMCERTVPDCPVLPLDNPPFADACSTSLEAGKGVDINNKCGALTDDMAAAAACIAKKIGALSSPHVDYTGPSATIRTAAYQNHLLEIWTKSQQLDTIMNSLSFTPEYSAKMKQVCAQRKMEIDGEKNRHGIKHRPSSAGDAAPHVEHRAIDVPEVVSDALMDQVTLYATTTTVVNGKKETTTVIVSDVEDYINSKTINPSSECASSPYISWGGRFDPSDWVHFQLP